VEGVSSHTAFLRPSDRHARRKSSGTMVIYPVDSRARAAARRATSHFGGLPRRGSSSVPVSLGRSRRRSLVVTSVGSVFPPHDGQRNWFSTTRQRTVDSCAWKSTVLTGGHRPSTAIPTTCVHMMQTISARKTVLREEEKSSDR